MKRPAVVLALTMICAALTACTGGRTPVGETPTRSWQEVGCPTDVRDSLVVNALCGFVEVPAHRDGTPETIKVFVARIRPPASEAAPGAGPLLVVGTDLGDRPNYAGIAPLAQRTGREVIVVDTRGTGHSQPALDCPEVTDLAVSALGVSSNDPDQQRAFQTAVATCFHRLLASDIDPSAFTLAEMAGDLENLRVALNVSEWTLVTYGSASRIALEAVRRQPQHINGLLLDSPETPGMDPRLVALRTATPVAGILAACTRNPGCAATYPRAAGLWRRAVTQLRMHPVTVQMPISASDPRDIDVHLDPALLIRVVRAILSNGSSIGVTVGAIPQLLDEISTGDAADFMARVARVLQWDQPFCVGYLPKCLPQHQPSLGVVYSTLCHDIAPFSDFDVPADLDTAALAAYRDSPYLSLCDGWPVGQADAQIATPIVTDVPTLVLVGEFAPYTPPDLVDPGFSGFAHARVIVVPGGTHNVAATSNCLLTYRNEWLDQPSEPPPTPTCVAELSVDWRLPS